MHTTRLRRERLGRWLLRHVRVRWIPGVGHAASTWSASSGIAPWASAPDATSAITLASAITSGSAIVKASGRYGCGREHVWRARVWRNNPRRRVLQYVWPARFSAVCLQRWAVCWSWVDRCGIDGGHCRGDGSHDRRADGPGDVEPTRSIDRIV